MIASTPSNAYVHTIICFAYWQQYKTFDGGKSRIVCVLNAYIYIYYTTLSLDMSHCVTMVLILYFILVRNKT